MTTGFSDAEAAGSSAGADTCAAGASTSDILRLLGSGATGAILMALGEGPLRTKGLTERVPGYTPRTIYRHTGRLAELDVLEREEEPGVPSKVIYTLTQGCGSELYELVNRFADAAMTRLADGRIDAHAWAALGLLAELWETGMIEELACDPRSAMELSQGAHSLSYHQVNRRAGLFRSAGLLGDWDGGGRRRYALTEKARRMMALIVGIARWRHHHVVGEGEEGMAAAEMATALRTVLPLVRINDGHSGECLKLSVLRGDEAAGGEGEVVWARVEADGSLHSCLDAVDMECAWARGRVGSWAEAILDGDPRKVLVGGEEQLAGDLLAQLHEVLWTPSPF